MSTGAIKIFTDEELKKMLLHLSNKLPSLSNLDFRLMLEIEKELDERGYKVDLSKGRRRLQGE